MNKMLYINNGKIKPLTVLRFVVVIQQTAEYSHLHHNVAI